MIGGVDDVQGCWGAEFLGCGAQKFEVGEGIAGALEKQHRNFHVGEMFGAFGVWAIRLMQREAEEDQAADVGE